MQMDQLFEFVYILIDKKQVTAQEMAERFGVSTRTVYRWVDTLSISGVPIYSTKGRGGGIAISEKYALDKTVLSEEERLSIVSSVKALSSLSGNMKGAEKLSNLVTTNTDWLEVDFAPWSPEGSGVRELFGLLRDSILKKRQVIFDYYTGDGRIERRTVHPWKLIYKGQAWYLQGWCTTRNAERFFKITRIKNLMLTGRTAQTRSALVQENKQTKTREQKSPQEFKQPPLIEIKAKVSAEKISYLMDSFICSEVSPHKDGTVTATFTVPEVDWLYEILLSFGPDMKIVSPKAVREKVVALAKGVVKLYK